jgi:hypothetical protein
LWATAATYSSDGRTSYPISADATEDFQIHRDWAAWGGGISGITFSAPAYTGCTGEYMFDTSLAHGWASDVGTRTVTVKLPQTIDVSSFAVDPGATCGDPDTASVNYYDIGTSSGPNGPWTTAASGNFTTSNDHKLNPVTPTNGKSYVRYVQFVMNTNQGDPKYMDASELEVYGTPSRRRVRRRSPERPPTTAGSRPDNGWASAAP